MNPTDSHANHSKHTKWIQREISQLVHRDVETKERAQSENDAEAPTAISRNSGQRFNDFTEAEAIYLLKQALGRIPTEPDIGVPVLPTDELSPDHAPLKRR